MRYSPSMNGFYPEEINYGNNLPEDLIVISQDFYINLLNGQSSGKVITPNGTDLPYLSEPPPPTIEQLIAEAESKKVRLLAEATAVIAPLKDAVDYDMATDEEAAALTAWTKYRVLLNRVDTLTTPDIIWPEKPE